MQYSFLNFLSSALVPELCTDVAACSPCDIHCILVCIATVRALPDELMMFIFNNLNFSVIAAFLAIITLCIQLCIDDCLIDVLHQRKNSLNIILHVRNFNIADCSARRKLLEACFFCQLVKCIDFFRYMDMIAVCDVILILMMPKRSCRHLENLYVVDSIGVP